MPLKKDIVATPYDFADYIYSEDDARAVIAVAFEDGDPAVITRMIGAVARSKGMTSVAEAAGLGRESLYKSLSANGNPELKTLVKVLGALGLRLAVEPHTNASVAGAIEQPSPESDQPVRAVPPKSVTGKVAAKR